ncbi:UDP-N-acetylglucosamine transferase subunit ALG14 [Candidatus Bathyarchaeota archaeon]|nr:UDP-N-acetylglucosamine transferase subunit ALG14 [Candidatus Bathyarchaeota archaeon]
MKVCLIGGAGGHLRELLQIASELKKNSIDFFFVTIDTPFTKSMERTYLVKLLGIDLPRLLVTNIINIYRALVIIKKESPNVVITTGPEFGIAYLVLGKVRNGALTMFVESLCRMSGPSLTGKLAWPFADVFLVQWREALAGSPKKAEFWGRVI